MEGVILIGFLVVLASVVVRMVRYGGVTGMLVGARTDEHLGRIEGQAAGHRRVTLGVRRLDDQRPVGIDFTGRAYMNVERIAASLSRDDARRLADALETAADEEEARA